MLDILMVDKRDSSMKQRSHCAVNAQVLTNYDESSTKKSHLFFLSLSAASEKTLCKVLGVVTERK